MSDQNETKEIPKLLTGYKLALGLGEIALGLGIPTFGNKALSVYQSLENYGFLAGQRFLLMRTVDNSIPFLIQHRLAITLFLLCLGAIESVSSTAILMNKVWGVHLLLAAMLILLPFDLFGMFKNFFEGHIGLGSIFLNAINIWIILSLTHNHPIAYLKKIRTQSKPSHASG
jgi:uncharacterized membrane protein (DUF2068 family)